MKKLKILLIKFILWVEWKRFLHDMKSVIGFKTIADVAEHTKQLEYKIRKDNNLRESETITWKNTSQNRKDFASYFTIRQFLERGEAFEKMKLCILQLQ